MSNTNTTMTEETITLTEIIERALRDEPADTATPESLLQAYQEWKAKNAE